MFRLHSSALFPHRDALAPASLMRGFYTRRVNPWRREEESLPQNHDAKAAGTRQHVSREEHRVHSLRATMLPGAPAPAAALASPAQAGKSHH